jgi:hypothetical protein
MQYLLIGHTKGDDITNSVPVILSEPSEDAEALRRLGQQTLAKARAAGASFEESTNGCYSELWKGSQLSRCEVVPVAVGQSV